MPKFYLTTPIYYVNDRPHIGHAYTTFAADVIAAWHRMRGDETFFLTGTDENAQKNAEAAAQRLGKPMAATTRAEIQAYVDEMSAMWSQTWDSLGIRYDRFIRTTEGSHVRGVEQFIVAVRARNPDDIYRGTYTGWYCVGCEAFVPETDVKDGMCPTHVRALEKLEEENYFFRLSRYRDALLRHIERNPRFVQPEARRNEIVAYISDHLTDISISRPMKNWGIPFPGDPSQTVYVWFDALTNYLTGVGYGADSEAQSSKLKAQFSNFWPASLHLVGKDIIKFHCALWPAMLMAAGCELPERVFAHGFFTIEGKKMSKSLGNVINPTVIADRYGTDVLRYFLLREIPFGGDGDFSEDRLRQRYASDLQHGIGNFAARTITMLQKYTSGKIPGADETSRVSSAWEQYTAAIYELRLHDALSVIEDVVRAGDHTIEEERPWQLAKLGEDQRLHRVLGDLAETLRHIALMLVPFMPTTADRILTTLGQGPAVQAPSLNTAGQGDWRSSRLTDLMAWGRMKEGTQVGKLEHLFPALS
jgi:methionyl-tRNA synthetase